jgi:hypothetical protein
MKWSTDWLQKRKEQRKIKEQERLIEALRRPEKEPRHRPAAKFATNRIRHK